MVKELCMLAETHSFIFQDFDEFVEPSGDERAEDRTNPVAVYLVSWLYTHKGFIQRVDV